MKSFSWQAYIKDIYGRLACRPVYIMSSQAILGVCSEKLVWLVPLRSLEHLKKPVACQDLMRRSTSELMCV